MLSLTHSLSPSRILHLLTESSLSPKEHLQNDPADIIPFLKAVLSSLYVIGMIQKDSVSEIETNWAALDTLIKASGSTASLTDLIDYFKNDFLHFLASKALLDPIKNSKCGGEASGLLQLLKEIHELRRSSTNDRSFDELHIGSIEGSLGTSFMEQANNIFQTPWKQLTMSIPIDQEMLRSSAPSPSPSRSQLSWASTSESSSSEGFLKANSSPLSRQYSFEPTTPIGSVLATSDWLVEATRDVV